LHTIKRIDNFEPWAWASKLNQGKLLTKLNPKYVRVFKSLPGLVNRKLLLKIVKCRNVFL